MEMEQFDTHPVNDYQAHHILSAERLILISAQNSSRTWLAKPASASWWLRVLTVVSFVAGIPLAVTGGVFALWLRGI